MPLQVVFLSLSGVGKSTVQMLLALQGVCEIGVACTTRKHRSSEPSDAYDYIHRVWYWVLVLFGRMCERSSNYGIRYGILRSRIERAKQANRPTVWVLNVAGLEWMRREFGTENVLPILLWAPPHILRQRMQGRGDDPADIERRLQATPQEVASALGAKAIQIDTTYLSPYEVVRAVRRKLGV